MQIDTTSTSTDCYLSVGVLGASISTIGTSFSSLSLSNYLAPVLALQNMLVEATTVFSNCGTSTLISQFSARTSSFSGLFNSFGNVAGSYLQSYMSGSSPLTTAISGITTPVDCASFSSNVGFVLQNLLNSQVPDSTYYTVVATSIASQV